MDGHSVHVRCSRRDRPARYRRKLLSRFVLVVRCATPLNAACHLFDPRVPQTYATFIALVSSLTVAKLHYLFTGPLGLMFEGKLGEKIPSLPFRFIFKPRFQRTYVGKKILFSSANRLEHV